MAALNTTAPGIIKVAGLSRSLAKPTTGPSSPAYLERTQRSLDRLTETICQREGWAVGDLRAKAVTATVFALVRLSLGELERRPEGAALSDIFREVLAAQASVLKQH
jgi:hypothetical protein